jgi:hypothetical protein
VWIFDGNINPKNRRDTNSRLSEVDSTIYAINKLSLQKGMGFEPLGFG